MKADDNTVARENAEDKTRQRIIAHGCTWGNFSWTEGEKETASKCNANLV